MVNLFGRRRLREILDEIDRFVEEVEKNVEKMVDEIQKAGDAIIGKPHVYGIAFSMGEKGPEVRTFGDLSLRNGHRVPYHEQFRDEGRGELKLVVEVPGVQKQDIELKASDDRVMISTGGERKYRADVSLQAHVDPRSASASFRNGLLDVTLRLKEKANKDFTKVQVE